MHRQITRWSMRRTLMAAAPLLAVLLMACPAPPAPPAPDADGDGVPDAQDTCANTPASEAVDTNGCAASQRDGDNDGVSDDVDQCQSTPAGTAVDEVGCPLAPDADGDGVPDTQDTCADTPAGEEVDETGCVVSQLDSDSDGVFDDVDECPTTPVEIIVDAVGCPVSVVGTPDDDEDGVANDIDQCPDTPVGATVDANGCVDSDGDGIADVDDICADTPPGAAVDMTGCADSQLDSDGDGVFDADDTCADTPAGATVDINGCADSQLDSDGDGVFDDVDLCADTPRGQAVDASGCPTGGGNGGDPACGDGNLDAGEECDDGNNTGGDGCDATCLNEPSDDCGNVRSIELGTRSFSTVGTTTDGPVVTAAACALLGDDQVGSDVWYCFTSTCNDLVVVSACGAAYDSKMAVYTGCDCPTGAPLACSDDDCGPGVGSRIELQAQNGEQYMIRIGGFTDAVDGTSTGTGTVTVFCADDPDHDVNACGPGAGDCFSGNGSTACDDVDCCVKTCGLDPFCCDTEWDDLCSQKAEGLCGAGFDSCAPGAGDCAAVGGNGSKGCENAACCQTVCEADPFCCVTKWDKFCADKFPTVCTPLEVCANATGDCLTANDTAGCAVQLCCEAVCSGDPACCDSVWNDSCAVRAGLIAACQ